MIYATTFAFFILCVVLLWIGIPRRISEPWKFLARGRQMLIQRAREHNGKPFSILIPGNRLHLVSSKAHWEDLNNTSLNHLSSHVWSKEHFQPKYTFGYEWPDRRQDDGMPVIRAIRTLSNQFSGLRERYVSLMESDLNDALKIYIQPNGISVIPLWETVKRLGSRMNIMMLFGQHIANDSEFVDRGLKYIDEVTLVSEAAKSFPLFLMPLMSRIIRGRNLNAQYVREIATHLILDIFTHPEYLPALREEVKDVLGNPASDINKLPLLENFLIESIRFHCFLSTVVHRVPLKSFSFSDGYTVPKGEIVEFYQYSVMNDETIHSNPNEFNPKRFEGKARKATDISMEWPFWGNSKMACPGRFHVCNVAKLIAIYFITNFDCDVTNSHNPSFEFRDVSVPHPKWELIMRRRTM
ncbi:cytochrome P450 [Aaosphaeria arxii CBS 175.79]|uniref:Cytochrome P450 n=1 Tax=Aaosphaeria arxii CBS 175.79 TaxID=1450172 RepID=A0A6A5XM50_9PLEO|nr:cytochrome P450 [Aaosphaeria arxii CBS 175.79]KAF2014222.1 cytochrome P450 [Aaosphaeria arxii CBS 175.79]